MPAETAMHVHVLGHPDVPLDLARFPENAQVFNCHNFCVLLGRARIPFVYYGVSGSRVPGGGQLADLGRPGGRWAYGNARHRAYTDRISRALAAAPPGRGQIIVSLYGAAHADIDAGDRPVVEAMVGYDHCWAPYRVFPSYAQQHVIYTQYEDATASTKWFDTVIPHFVEAERYRVAEAPEDYVLFLGRDAPDKGVALARDVCERARVPLRVVHSGLGGEAKAELLSRALAVIMPTLYLEPFGYVAIEAQMSGVPVICTDWGAFAETVVHGVTGFRCRTAAEFREALRRAPGLCRRRIRERALRHYSMEAVMPLYVDYLKFVLTVHTGGGFYAEGAVRWRSVTPPDDPCTGDGDR